MTTMSTFNTKDIKKLCQSVENVKTALDDFDGEVVEFNMRTNFDHAIKLIDACIVRINNFEGKGVVSGKRKRSPKVKDMTNCSPIEQLALKVAELRRAVVNHDGQHDDDDSDYEDEHGTFKHSLYILAYCQERIDNWVVEDEESEDESEDDGDSESDDDSDSD